MARFQLNPNETAMENLWRAARMATAVIARSHNFWNLWGEYKQEAFERITIATVSHFIRMKVRGGGYRRYTKDGSKKLSFFDNVLSSCYGSASNVVNLYIKEIKARRLEGDIEPMKFCLSYADKLPLYTNKNDAPSKGCAYNKGITELVLPAQRADRARELLKADNVTKGFLVQGPYKNLLDSGINSGSGVGDASTPIYVDTDGTFKAGNAVVNGGKHSHTAELYYHHYDDGDHYHIRNVKNYCINHVAITNHSADICYIEIEAPTLGTNEEYDYYVVFDCTNSSGGCNVTVQNCDAEIFNFPYYNPNGPQGQPYVAFQDKTYTWVELSGSPRYHVEVIGNRYTIHRF